MLGKRQTTATTIHSTATCHGCDWTNEAANALATAARHHDNTGHAVTTDIRRVVIFGDPTAPMRGQLPLEEGSA